MEKIPIRPAARSSSPSRLSSYSLSLYRVLRLRNRGQSANQPIRRGAGVASSAIVLRPIEISAGQSGIGGTPLPNCVPLLNINPVRHVETKEIRGAILFQPEVSYVYSLDTLGGGRHLLGLLDLLNIPNLFLPRFQDLSWIQNDGGWLGFAR